MTTIAEAYAQKELERQIDRASTELRFVNLGLQVHNETERESVETLAEINKNYSYNPDHLKEGER